MSTPGFALGIDLGTSNTVAVLRWPDGRVKPLLFDGTPLLPSAVYAEPDGRTLLTGRDAVHSARIDPARYEPNPKRRIDDGTVLLGDTELPVVNLFAAVLARVVEEAKRTCGGTVPPQATLTCPAAWAAPRRAVLLAAADAAGLGTVRLAEEPVAAAAYFVKVLGRDVPVGSVVVVHDFGAGTFDASVVARTATGFEVLAVDGRGDIGGLDLDAALVDHLGQTYAAQDPESWARLTSPTTVGDRRQRRMLWDDVRVAKERLSRAQRAELVLPLLNLDVHLTREELERLAQPILEQTVRVTQGAMRWAKLPERRSENGTDRKIAGVFLVGGASRIPLVATLLHRTLGEPPVAIEQPELVVAEGSLFVGESRPTVRSATVMVPVIRPEAVRPGSGQPGYPAPASAAPVSASPVSGSPVSGSPVSGSPVSGSPISGSPISGSPISGSPISGSPISGRPAYGVPAAAGPAGMLPVSASGAGRPGQVSAPGVGRPGQVSAPGVGRPGQVSPAGAGSGGRAGSVARAASGQPAFAPGRAVLPAPAGTHESAPPLPATRTMPRTNAPVSPARSPRPQQRSRPQPPRPPAYPPPRPSYPAPAPYPAPAGGFGTFIRRLFIAVVLLATPVVAAYLAYKLTLGEPVWPVTVP